MLFRDVLRPVRREAEFHEQVGNVFLVGLGGRIFLRDDLIQLRFGVLTAGTKAVVPDVERLERAPQRD